MPVNPAERLLVERYFRAMQSGPGGEEELLSLFSDDAEYIEPFSAEGRATAHKGIAAIRAFFHSSFQGALSRDVQLTLIRLDVDGAELRSEWTCVMPALPGRVRGSDHYIIRDGKIQRLEVALAPPATGDQ